MDPESKGTILGPGTKRVAFALKPQRPKHYTRYKPVVAIERHKDGRSLHFGSGHLSSWKQDGELICTGNRIEISLVLSAVPNLNSPVRFKICDSEIPLNSTKD